MSRLLSDRAAKTSDMVVLPATLEDSKRTPAGVYRVGLISICGSIFAFFAALVIAYWWRSQTPPFWDAIPLPGALWASIFMVDLLAVAVLYTTLAFLLAAGLRLYQDMRAVAAENTALADAAQMAPTAPLPSVTA